MAGYRPQTETDVRRLLECNDLDAISVATPEHWHALVTIWGCQAGRDVYCKKPCAYLPQTGRGMVEVDRKYLRMVQIGLQRRSRLRVRSVPRFFRDGGFGKANCAKPVSYRGRTSVGKVQEASVPEGVEWNMCLGSVPYRAFELTRSHHGGHFFWDASTSDIGNNGVHHVDVLWWGLDKHVHPVKIHCAGGFFFTDRGDADFADGWAATRGDFNPRNCPDSLSGVSYRTNNLSFPNIAYHSGPEISNIDEPKINPFQNFIDRVCSRQREDLNCKVEQGHLSTSLCHLANISYRVHGKIDFDLETETFPGDGEANHWLTRGCRKLYPVPDQV